MAENVKGLNIEIGLDTTQLKKGLSDVKKDLKANSTELKQINKNLKFDINPLNSMGKKLETLKDRVRLLNEQLKKEKAILDQMRSASQNGLISEAKVEKQAEEVAKLNRELETTSLEAQKVEYDMNQMSEKSTNSVGNMAKNIKTKVAVVIATIASVIKMATSAITTATDIREEANEAGLAMEAFQRLATAGQMLGVSQNSVKKSLLEVNGLLSDIAGHNSTDATKALETLGLDLEKLQEMGTEGAFYEIIDALNQVQDKNERLNYATQIFGQRYATAILPMLEKGTKVVKDLADNAEGIWTEEQAEVSAKVQNSLGDLKNDLLMIVSDLLPFIQEFVEGLRDIFNGDLGDFLKWVFNYLGVALRQTIPFLKRVVEVVSPFLRTLEHILEPLQVIIGGLLKVIENSVVLKVLEALGNFLDWLTGGNNNPNKSEEEMLQDTIRSSDYDNPNKYDPSDFSDLEDIFGEDFGRDIVDDSPSSNSRPRNRESVGDTNNNTYYVTINTTASRFSIDELDEEIGRQL